MQRSYSEKSSGWSNGPAPKLPPARGRRSWRLCASGVSGGTWPSTGSITSEVRADFRPQFSYQCTGPAPVTPPMVGAVPARWCSRCSSSASSSVPSTLALVCPRGRSNGTPASSSLDQTPCRSGSPHGVRGTEYVEIGLETAGAGTCARKGGTHTAPAVKRPAASAPVSGVRITNWKPEVPKTLLLLQVPVEQLFGELHALELEQLHVRLERAVERHAALPRPPERLRVRHRGFVDERVLALQRVTLLDRQRLGVVVAGAVEPRRVVETVHRDDQRVAVPLAVRPPHPAVHRRLGVIRHVDDAVRARILVHEQDVLLALDDLERIGHVVRARDARHVALGFRIALRPAGAKLLTLLQRRRRVGNHAVGRIHDDALAGRD